MAMYIDAEATVKRFEELHGDLNPMLNVYNADWIVSFIEAQPPADVQEVRHGRWLPFQVMDFSPVPKTVALSCSLCQDIIFGEKLPAYCPSCGAKMDAKQQEKQ